MNKTDLVTELLAALKIGHGYVERIDFMIARDDPQNRTTWPDLTRMNTAIEKAEQYLAAQLEP